MRFDILNSLDVAQSVTDGRTDGQVAVCNSAVDRPALKRPQLYDYRSCYNGSTTMNLMHGPPGVPVEGSRQQSCRYRFLPYIVSCMHQPTIIGVFNYLRLNNAGTTAEIAALSCTIRIFAFSRLSVKYRHESYRPNAEN